VIDRPRVVDDGCYAVRDGGLPVGSTLGGDDLCVVLKGNGQIDYVRSLRAGANLISGLAVRHWDVEASIRLDARDGTYTLRPHRQEHAYVLGDGVRVEEAVVVDDDGTAPPACYVVLKLRNDGARTVRLATAVFASIAEAPIAHDLDVRADEALRAVLVASREDARCARALVSSAPLVSWTVCSDHALAVADRWHGPLDRCVDAGGSDPLAILHVEHRLAPGSQVDLWFAVVALDDLAGAADALARLHATADDEQRVRARYDAALARTVVMTPSNEVNLGVRWAKANMLRVMRASPTGPGFSNDPGRSSACVGRDAAWFVHGCDYVDAAFSLALLRGFAQRQEPDGKIVEWYDLRTGETHDDGLNVNDDTPLFVLAVWHHAAVSGDRAVLSELYPAAARAGEFLLAQRDRRGLVWCSANGTGAHGIAGWRNVIEGYRIAGATTELNSETYAALRRLADLARALERDAEAARWDREAAALHAAVERHLRNPSNGLYLLAIDVDERPRTEVTADLVFPLIFGISDAATSARIVARLRERDFWTRAGVRTISRESPEYGPTRGSGLLGGVWVAVTFWYAFGAAPFVPEVMAEALATSFEHYGRDPCATNTVPGQFSEWLHGETLANQGMMLSPWFPPRYVWAAVEGACGLRPGLDVPCIAPNLPPGWSWAAARDVPRRGGSLTWVAARFPEVRVFASGDVRATVPLEAYGADVTRDVSVEGRDAAVVAFAREGEVLVFLGNLAPHTVSTSVRLEGRLRGLAPRRQYDSLSARWAEPAASDAASVPVTLARGGFAVIELS
jgi:hypothetical protein